VLNERERQVLARIEHHLMITDPEFTSLFHAVTPQRTGVSPRMLLVVGLLLLVLGAATTAVPIAVLGMLVAAFAVVAAYQRSGSAGFSAA
jgi:hypothetical protein